MTAGDPPARASYGRAGGLPPGLSASGAEHPPLAARFAAHVRRRGLMEEGDPVVVAVSGGVDSTVLLHILRFAPPVGGLSLSAAHFDHGLRPESSQDAAWVRGLCHAWGVPLDEARAAEPPDGEAAARRARYRFLAGVRRSRGARWVATGHQADDQAETVLFRILRGTGLSGLAGIRERRAPGILRPLLPFWRGEVEAYARAVGLGHREDASNRDPRFARNVLRHELIPRAEEAVAPGARAALVRLAGLAAGAERAWRSLLPGLLGEVVVDEGGDRVAVARSALLEYDLYIRALVIRELARRFGTRLDEAGTRTALEFVGSGASGRHVHLPGGLRISREFDRIVLGRPGGGVDRPLEIPSGESGSGVVVLGGHRWRVRWSSGPEAVEGRRERFLLSRLRFPLRLRAWSSGDRIRLPYGSKKLKKLLAEKRVPAGERPRVPVLVDAAGEVLWVPGLARSVQAPGEGGAGATLTIEVLDAGSG